MGDSDDASAFSWVTLELLYINQNSKQASVITGLLPRHQFLGFSHTHPFEQETKHILKTSLLNQSYLYLHFQTFKLALEDLQSHAILENKF